MLSCRDGFRWPTQHPDLKRTKDELLCSLDYSFQFLMAISLQIISYFSFGHWSSAHSHVLLLLVPLMFPMFSSELFVCWIILLIAEELSWIYTGAAEATICPSGLFLTLLSMVLELVPQASLPLFISIQSFQLILNGAETQHFILKLCPSYNASWYSFLSVSWPLRRLLLIYSLSHGS